jgi:NADPH:quinone reductase-like Zn-dependent oxidoreductase
VLKLEEVEKPVPAANEVLVKVFAASVNRTDCANLTAKPDIMRLTMGLFKPKNPILGTEFAGKIEAIGENVKTFAVGDDVFGFNDSGVRSYAEYLVIGVDQALSTIPDSLSYKQAAGCIEGAHYAYNFINKVSLKAGDNVLVNGASGGIGSAMVQLLKYYGANVTAVCSTQSISIIASLGADKIVDYEKEDFTTDTGLYDFVFDAVGKSSFGYCKHLLKEGGVYISSELGWMSQNVFFSLITAIFGNLPAQNGKKVKFPYPPNISRSITLIKKMIEENKFKPVIDRTYPFEQIPDAFRFVQTGKKMGNVVIELTKTP